MGGTKVVATATATGHAAVFSTADAVAAPVMELPRTPRIRLSLMCYDDCF